MFKKTPLVMGALILGTLLLLARQPLARATVQFQSPVATPASTEESTAGETMPTLADLLARIQVLEAEVAALSAPAEPINQVATAVYLLDNAGLHDLDVRLNEEGVIEAGDSGLVARLARLLSSVSWPHDLAADAETLVVVLNDLSAALADDVLENAAPLSTQAHDGAHELSHAAEEWLAEAETPMAQDDAVAAFQVASALYLLDNAGLHSLDTRLNEEGVIEAGDSGRVARLARLLATVNWPQDMSDDAATLIATLNDLSSALADDALESAGPLATETHDVAHELSHAGEHWLGEMQGSHDHDAIHDDDADPADHGDDQPHDDSSSGG